jgi:nucleoside 2-deoxyribosyltransferase
MVERSKKLETGKFVYLSGDIFNEDCKINFTLAQNFLEDLGYVVINPAQLAKIADSLAQEQIMQIRYRLVEVSNKIFMVSGWQKSKSANAELSYAKSLGKKVMYQDYYAPFRRVSEYE